MNKDDLGNRMKTNYEQIPKTKLMRRCPVVVRIDMRCGHTYCKGFKRPFDDVFIKSIQDTALYLAKNVSGCVLTYQQSDEISLLLIDYKKLESQAFFDYEVQKVCSITASMATLAFSKAFRDISERYFNSILTDHQLLYLNDEDQKYCDIIKRAINKGAMFDSRCFNIPVEEVTNYFYWRESDAIRNSIQMVGQANFSHKELQNKSCANIKDMLLEKGIDWDGLPIHQQRGSCCVKTSENVNGILRSKWVIDNDIPIFINEGRVYIDERLLMFLWDLKS